MNETDIVGTLMDLADSWGIWEMLLTSSLYVCTYAFRISGKHALDTIKKVKKL